VSEVPYIEVVNFDRFQHYKDRNPPWIKLYGTLLDDYQFSRLQDASKMHLLGIWLLASKCENRVPADPQWIGQRIGATELVNLQVLIAAGFLNLIQPASNPIATREQSAMPETEESRDREEGEEEAAAAPATGRRTMESQQYQRVLAQVPAHYQPAFEGAFRSARSPASLLAELEAIATGLHPPAYDYAVIGRALHDMAVANCPVTARAIRGFCRKAAELPPEEIEDRTDDFGRMRPHRKRPDGTWEPVGDAA
jgi:hypothetical protein